MPEVPVSVRYVGRPQLASERRLLRAGPLTALLEGPDLRYIRLGEREIVRRIYVAIRDANWNTILPELSDVQVDTTDDHFSVTFEAVNRAGAIDFAWHGEITGHADGVIRYAMAGVARRDFRKNRIGICVLHPMEDAGRPCLVEHTDGSTEPGVFPRWISPHQPFMDFRALSMPLGADATAEVRLTGDVFEMEDQRNWTDASFKTYSTPINLPYPAAVARGATIAQSCTIALHGPARTDTLPAALRCSVDAAATEPLPAIGVGMAAHGRPLTETEVARLRALNLAHLRADLRLDNPAYRDRLRLAAAESAAIAVPLHLALHVTANAEAELADLRTLCHEVRPNVGAWLVFHGDEKTTAARWLTLARQVLGDLRPGALIVGGSDAYFTEINRFRPPVDALDAVTFSISPQVHAFDDASLVETLACQAETLGSARQFCADRPLFVGAVTLQPRFNPNATGPQPPPEPGVLPPEVDTRQMALFGAGWTVGSLKYLTAGRAAAATYYETTGWRGVMETEAGPPDPALFPSVPGMLFPLYHVLADFGEFAGGEALRVTTSDRLAVDGLALRRGERWRVLIANLTAQAQTVTVDLPCRAAWRTRLLDERTFGAATQDGDAYRREAGAAVELTDRLDVALASFAVARLDAMAP